MIVQNTIFTTNFVPIQRFHDWIFPLGDAEKKKTVEPSSWWQCRANAELSFEMGSTLSLQWLCKIPFSQLTSFQLRDLMTGVFPLETQKKKLLNRLAVDSAGQMQSYPSKYVRHYHHNVCANYHFHNWLRSNWEIWWLEFSPWRRSKRKMLNRVAEDSAGQMQSYPSKWVRHYHYNDCAKYHFHNWLRSIWGIWWLEFSPWRRTKKILLNRLAGDSAGQMQSYSSKWVQHYHYNDCAKYHFHN